VRRPLVIKADVIQGAIMPPAAFASAIIGAG